jgi:hypothetical protein
MPQLEGVGEAIPSILIVPLSRTIIDDQRSHSALFDELEIVALIPGQMVNPLVRQAIQVVDERTVAI